MEEKMLTMKQESEIKEKAQKIKEEKKLRKIYPMVVFGEAGDEKEITSYKLEIVASQLGVDLDDAHDAAADVTATLDVLGVYTSRLRNNEGATMPTQQRDKTRKHFKI